jgi:peptide deformylase
MQIFTVNNKKEEKFLRRKTPEFSAKGGPASGWDFKSAKNEIWEVIKKMRAIIKKENGVGLSANQIGLNWRLFIAEIPSEKGKPKFYAIFNPDISKASKNKIILEEGCLSVPGIWGLVERPEQIVLIGFDKNGKKIKIKAWGLLARVFQHEIDHLNGILFIDRAKKLLKEVSGKPVKI